MASKMKTCDFCGKRCQKKDMVVYKNELLCDERCKELWIEAYENEEAKSIE